METIDQPTIRPVINIADYRIFPYVIENIHLEFDLTAKKTIVQSHMLISKNSNYANDADDNACPSLILDGEDLKLLAIKIDGAALTAKDYVKSDNRLTINNLPTKFKLYIKTEINPQDNKKLEGLYKSGSAYCTQCEAEGFRRITYFPDRPDVMSRYKVTIRANKTANPILLSNGNNIENGDLTDNIHYAVWDDPFPKPSYLFALVAGDLAEVSDGFTTKSGRNVDLKIFVEHGNDNKCDYAMDALKRSMRWDEVRFNLEYDLDIFNIVAVSDFNMGAMENKSLNIFNAKYILADKNSATDADFANIEAIVAHEYFHNWTGNRVTCRDWFQLSLKEGLTVFRDQEFSADQRSKSLTRINDVRQLRARQFPEDASPLSHPVRPESYMEINNFYTATIYEKGAEVIRMIHSILGEEDFQKGCGLYFQRYDGMAVTCDDFIKAMVDASDVDLSQFKLWYSQSGTPKVTIHEEYDSENKIYRLKLSQTTDPTADQAIKKPLHIPLKIAVLGKDGKPQQATYLTETADEHLLHLKSASEDFNFENIAEKPMLSINRNFTAPIIIENNNDNIAKAFLMAHDNDSFCRWEACQQFSCDILLKITKDIQSGKDINNITINNDYIKAMGKIINDDGLDNGFKSLLLTLPSEEYIAEQMTVIDVDAIHQARQYLRQTIAMTYQKDFIRIYNEQIINDDFEPTSAQAGKRSLRNLSLFYMAIACKDNASEILYNHFKSSNNMTDIIAGLAELCQLNTAEKTKALAEFHDEWQNDPQVMDKWLMIQATAKNNNSLNNVKSLMKHPIFNINNPNKIRALIGAFSMANPTGFHDKSGSGYDFLAGEVIKIDKINPQVAARLLSPLGQWRRFDEIRQDKMTAALKRILAQKDLSSDVFEIASKSLASNSLGE